MLTVLLLLELIVGVLIFVFYYIPNSPRGDGVPGSRGGSQGGGREVRVISPRLI